ncbi:MAG: sulfatase-like hydrolase/transferase [Chthoniobacteraceae bacterium]
MVPPISVSSRVAICFSAVLFALLCARATAQPHNVLVIIADDLGADSFPLTAGVGASVPPMPNISALKNSGVLFKNARANPTCSPTRASMLTGRHPFRTGIGAQLMGATSPQLQASEFTLPESFTANAPGYAMAMFGKWHLNAGAGTNDTPRTIGGWPHFAGTISGALGDYSSWTKITNNMSAASTTYATTDIANDTIAFIDAQTGPWFAWAAFNAPHTPFHVPPAGLHSYGSPATNRTQYEAMCEALDTEVGRILARPNASLATTHVIFIGDNGTPMNVIQTPYNAAHSKETLYDGGTRVPLIIAGPSIVSPNRDSTVPVNCVDIYSTILELAGIDVEATQPPANPIDSVSLLPILANTTDTERTGFSQTFSSTLALSVSGRAITDAAGYTLIQFDDGREEFYLTTTDTNQTTNLLGASISNAAQAAYAALKLKVANFTASGVAHDPLVSSWLTTNTGEYARIYPTLADQTSGTSATTWSRGAGEQNAPTYADVHQVDFSDAWVYIHTTGLASHTMGPWYLNAAKTTLFPNYPSNTATTFRFPRVPVIPGTKALTGLGATGRMVNGVSMFDSRDAFSYSNVNAADATPGGGFNGDGIWNRDGYHNEGVTFDPALAHQAGNNYHYHAQPIGLRHQLGDHVDYNPTTNAYTESAAAVTKHSPILAWATDGLPVYGPYGYGDPNNAGSAVRRMVSGFVLRNGANGTTNLAITGRTTLPAWAARVQSRSATLAANQYGPAVNTTYALGHYIEDFDYLGDLGFTHGTDFDLNEQNVRFCLTPEYPAGTWAYFTTINADNTPAYPYTTGRQFYGDPTGGSVTTITEPVATSFTGGPFKTDRSGGTSVNAANGDVTMTWSGIEGGVYNIEVSGTLTSWTTLSTGISPANDDTGAVVETGGATGQTTRFYRTVRTGVSAYDKIGFAGTVGGGNATSVAPGGSAARGTTVDVTITFGGNVPVNVQPLSVTLAGTIAGSTFSRPATNQVKATFVIPAGAPTGAQNIFIQFPTPSFTLTGGFTIN